MIEIFKNKHLKITICLILIFTISINFMFYQKVQAVGITAGLAIKAMAVILSSMGVLHVVQNNGGIQSFFDSFTLFNHEGLNALRDMAINNIVHKVKIKANNVIASIREFFNSWSRENLVDEWDIIDGVKLANTYEFNFSSPHSWTPILLEDIIFQDEFNTVSIRYRRDYWTIKTDILVNGNVVGTTPGVDILNDVFVNPSRDAFYNFKTLYQLTEDKLYITGNLINYTYNQSATYTVSINLSVNAITNPPGYVDPTYDIPQPQSLPRNGVDIAWDEATNKSISYLPGETKLEKLIEDIANASVETFVENYTSWGKATTDSLTGPIISTETRVNQETGVEEQVVTDVTETVFDDIYEETQTQTGLLGSILGAITDLKDFIKSIFIPEEFNSLDFSPLQNIGLSDKFPFSLPWDIKNSVLALTANPEAPVFDVPIVTETITLDFSEFESWASIIRVFTTLIFVIGLIILTRRLI